ncbi:hypothetical protein ACJRW5_13850 [Pseudomonas sp. SH1-B]
MPSQRLIAFLSAVGLCLSANHSLAEQISGQLQISLTILKTCEVLTQRTEAVVQVDGRGCGDAPYQLQDERGQPLPLTSGTAASRQSFENAGSTLVVYW